MAPPQLPADAPGLDIAHPGKESVFPLFRHKLGAARLDGGDRGLGQLSGVAIPLHRHQRLDRHARAIAVRHLVQMRLGQHQQFQPLQLGDDRLAGGEPVLAGERSDKRDAGDARHIPKFAFDLGERDARRAVQDRRLRQVMALADDKIVEIMPGGDLDRAGALLRVGVAVGDDRNAPTNKRKEGELAGHGGQIRVIRMHGDGGITQHGLGPGRRHGDEVSGFAIDRIGDVPKAAADFPAFDLEIGNRRLEFGIPVDQPVVAIDQPLTVKGDEHLAHRDRKTFIHGEPLARPIERGAEAAQLARDVAAGLGLPLPHRVEELFPPERLPGDALVRQQPLHHHLRGDAGMIGAWLPKHVAALHPAPSDQRVLNGEGQGVPGMQGAGDVWRWDHDGERHGVRGRVGGERAGVLPALVKPGLGLVRSMGFVQHDEISCRRG